MGFIAFQVIYIEISNFNERFHVSISCFLSCLWFKPPLHSESSKFCCKAATDAFQEEPNTKHRIRSHESTERLHRGKKYFYTHRIQNRYWAQDRTRLLFGIYTGTASFYRGKDWLESMLLAFHSGTTSWFTDLCVDDASRLLVTEWMIGHAAPLLTDLGRAHNVLTLGR